MSPIDRRTFLKAAGALGLAGLVFLVAPGRFAGGSHVDPLGAAALLTAALLWAIGSLYSRRAKLPSSTLLATAMEMIAGGLILLVVAALAREWQGFSLAAVSARSLWALAGEVLTPRVSLAAVVIIGAVVLIIRHGGDEPGLAAEERDLGCTKAPETLHA